MKKTRSIILYIHIGLIMWVIILVYPSKLLVTSRKASLALLYDVIKLDHPLSHLFHRHVSTASLKLKELKIIILSLILNNVILFSKIKLINSLFFPFFRLVTCLLCPFFLLVTCFFWTFWIIEKVYSNIKFEIGWP